MVSNFTGFAPLGTVLVALLGIAVAEHSGLLATGLRLLVTSSPRRLLTPIVVFAGIMSNMASEIGYVLLIPMAGILFQAAGRHPILGLAAAFAGVSGGYSANLLIGTIDPLLSGLSQEAARIIDPNRMVSPLANWYFMIVSTPVLTILGWWVTDKLLAPRFAAPAAQTMAADTEISHPLTAAEKRGFRYAVIAAVFTSAVLVWATLPKDFLPATGFLRNPNNGQLLHSPFLSGIVAIIFLYGVVIGLAYGIGAGTIRQDADVIAGMSQGMATLGSYLVLVFFASQFVAYFNWTQLGLFIAVYGADWLKALQLPALPLFFCFILFSAFANLFMGSASAKWALLAPVFVPMFMLLGYSPELTQTAYRIGDSVTNIISPMMSYFALIIAFFQRYEPKSGLGTVVSVMLPYSLFFLFGWSLLFALWLLLGLPVGPNSPLTYP